MNNRRDIKTRKDNNPQQFDELLKKYQKMKVTDNESLLSNTNNRSGTQSLLWDDALMGEKEEVFLAIKNGIEKKIAKKHKQRVRKIITISTSAAALVFLLIGSFVFTNTFEKHVAIITAQTSTVADSIILTDGTIVYLSPNTTFEYTKKDSKHERNVAIIKGNAFFKVARNPKKPFIVTSGMIKTKVLGTSFSIHYNHDNYYVAVHTGKVNITTETESVNLLQFQEAFYSKEDDKLSVNSVNEQEIAPWYSSDIMLTNQRISTILKIIKQKYGIVNISVAPELLQQNATVYIAKNEPLDSLIEQINYITNLKFKAYDGIIICEN